MLGQQGLCVLLRHGEAVIVAYVFHWWVAVLIVLGVPAAMFGLLVLWFWLGYRWRSDS